MPGRMYLLFPMKAPLQSPFSLQPAMSVLGFSFFVAIKCWALSTLVRFGAGVSGAAPLGSPKLCLSAPVLSLALTTVRKYCGRRECESI